MQNLVAREGQQLPRQRRCPLHRLRDPAEPVRHEGIAAGVVLELVDVGEDHHEHVVEIVRDAACELADRFHLLSLPELRFDGVACGDILHDREHRWPAVELQRPGVHLDIEDRAVLLSMPQPADDPAFLRHVGRPLGFERRQVFRGIELIDRHGENLLARPTILRHCGIVDGQEPACGPVDHHHRIGVSPENTAISILGCVMGVALAHQAHREPRQSGSGDTPPDRHDPCGLFPRCERTPDSLGNRNAEARVSRDPGVGDEPVLAIDEAHSPQSPLSAPHVQAGAHLPFREGSPHAELVVWAAHHDDAVVPPQRRRLILDGLAVGP